MNYSEKEEEINERKRKLMELMNSKSVKRVDLPETRTTAFTPMREKSHSNRHDIGDYVKESLTAERNLFAKDYSTPTNVAKYSTEEYSYKTPINSNQESVTSKRVKTAFF